MREAPPKSLVRLLERLHLAGDGHVQAIRRRVRRLARDLPVFESVWIDALAQARVLTPFQASELNAGRGEALRAGPYVLCRPLPSPGYLRCYVARHVETGQVVRLAVKEVAADSADELRRRLEDLVAAGRSVVSEYVAPVIDAGVDAGRLWAASRHTDARTAAEWLVRSGRFPPKAVCEIARQMLAGLTAIERAGICHGDISAAGVVLHDSGRIELPQPGLRGIVRPAEGYGHADLPPEDYDSVAPERIASGAPPDTPGDTYACGCLWWHLLAGRPPIPGGDALTKLRNLQSASIPDVRSLAPETPAPLAAAVAACTRRDPADRPKSLSSLAGVLGPPDRDGAKAVRRLGLRSPGRPKWIDAVKRIPMTPWRLAACGGLLVLPLVAWSLWAGKPPGTTASIPAAPPALRDEAARTPSGSQQPSPNALRTRPAPTAAGAAKASASGAAPDLVLPADRAVQIDLASLRPGQVVRGEPGKRPLVVVPQDGLVVRTEAIRFENIDFVAGNAGPAALPKPPAAQSSAAAAIVELRAWRAEFRGCSFQAPRDCPRLPVAIRWRPETSAAQPEMALPSGQVRLADCVFRNVQAGVAYTQAGTVSVELVNALCLGPGPLVRLDGCPKADESVILRLSHVTLRAGGPLLECRYARLEDPAGPISIEADNSIFLPVGPSAVVRFSGPGSPARLWENLRWTGQGSLVGSDVAVAQWQSSEGKVQTLDDASAAIAGLVRGEVEFAGRAEEGPEAQRAVRWQAPLNSAEAPGVDPKRLSWPAPDGPLAVRAAETFDKARP